MTLTQEVIERVIASVYEGGSLTNALKEHGVKRQSFYEFIGDNLVCAEKYAHARRSRVELMVEQLPTIADDPEIDPNRARNMLDVRKWTASKLIPHVYGDRLELNVKNEISLADALAEARARMIPQCDPSTFVESEVVETKAINNESATGSKPVNMSTELETVPDPGGTAAPTPGK